MRLLRAGQRGAPPLNCDVRRHVSTAVVLILGSLLSGCGATKPYAQTAAMLSTTGYQWVPLDRDSSAARDSAADFNACITSITTQIERVREEGYGLSIPSREARVLELLECMQMKGWDFEYNKILDEIGVTNG